MRRRCSPITDERGRNSGRPVIVKAYNTVRGSAAKHVKAALPAAQANALG